MVCNGGGDPGRKSVRGNARGVQRSGQCVLDEVIWWRTSDLTQELGEVGVVGGGQHEPLLKRCGAIFHACIKLCVSVAKNFLPCCRAEQNHGSCGEQPWRR